VEEKTWWQKNWMLVMGVGMAVMNLLGQLAKQQQQQPIQAAAGARAATTARG
jgi:hypothetical protein